MKTMGRNLLLIMLILGLVSFPLVLAVEDDTSEGVGNLVFQLTWPPTFYSSFNAITFIPPFEDIEFSITVEDTDNTSDELTVVLYYSNDSFVSQNLSVPMTFDYSPGPDLYKYIYEMTGQQDRVYLEYYYYVTDGEYILINPSSGFFDIYWGQTYSPTTDNPFVGLGLLNAWGIILMQVGFLILATCGTIIVIVRIFEKMR